MDNNRNEMQRYENQRHELQVSDYEFGPQQEINLKDYWEKIRRRKGTVLTFAAVVFVLTAFWTFVQRPVYTAKGTLLIEKEPNILSFEQVFQIEVADQQLRHVLLLVALVPLLRHLGAVHDAQLRGDLIGDLETVRRDDDVVRDHRLVRQRLLAGRVRGRDLLRLQVRQDRLRPDRGRDPLHLLAVHQGVLESRLDDLGLGRTLGGVHFDGGEDQALDQLSVAVHGLLLGW